MMFHWTDGQGSLSMETDIYIPWVVGTFGYC